MDQTLEAGQLGDNKSIYAEFVDPAGCIGPDTNVARNVVQLYE